MGGGGGAVRGSETGALAVAGRRGMGKGTWTWPAGRAQGRGEQTPLHAGEAGHMTKWRRG